MAELASLHIKKDQLGVARTKLTNILAELRTEEIRGTTDRHIASVTLPDKQNLNTNESICVAFRSYF